MKMTGWIFLGLILTAVIVAAVRFFLERKRQQQVDREGVVVLATFVSSEPVKFLGKPQGDLAKITLRLQDPGTTEPREVSLRTRTGPQPMQPGMRVPVVIDPKNANRVFPASAEAQARLTVTGSRLERRAIQSQLRTPGRQGPQAPTGYMPPTNALGGRGKRR
jgi:hypothetical protein